MDIVVTHRLVLRSALVGVALAGMATLAACTCNGDQPAADVDHEEVAAADEEAETKDTATEPEPTARRTTSTSRSTQRSVSKYVMEEGEEPTTAPPPRSTRTTTRTEPAVQPDPVVSVPPEPTPEVVSAPAVTPQPMVRPEPEVTPEPVVTPPSPVVTTPVVRPPSPVLEPDDAVADADIPDEPEPEAVPDWILLGLDPTCLPTDLEAKAMEGGLSAAEVTCLENTLANAPRGLGQEQVSLVLIANTYAKGEVEEWEDLVRRHLYDVDPTNPAVSYRYALHLFEKGPENSAYALYWAEEALENRAAWTGDSYTRSVYSLYKLRAAAAQNLWRKAEEDREANPTLDNEEAAAKAREFTTECAREWFDFARETGQEVAIANQLCSMASGKDCEAGG